MQTYRDPLKIILQKGIENFYSRRRLCTVWKFQDFYVIQNLREINLGESRSCKTI